ncbi:hypothetical protein [Halomicrobium urmianum]|uniref:hypothetical protein n=1 Tax=Halomicrobium urmianum TaxID=1586233 RepID=UPI001CD9C80F|nr:hypothetical protein [Halomicrobium urmianum]
MSVADTVLDHVEEHRGGIVADMVFAVAWVGAVSLVFGLLGAPQWAHYLAMALGVAAYYGFFWSLAIAREQQSAAE